MSHILSRLASLPAAIVLALVLAAPVFADAALIEANPDNKAVLPTPPTVVTLRFNQGVDAGKSSFRLIGPDGEVGVGRPAKDGEKVMALGDLTLGPGEYAIKWTVGSEDGHLVRGKLAFTVLEPTPEPATAAPAPATAAPATAAPATTATPTDVPDASAPPATPASNEASPTPEPAATPAIEPAQSTTSASGTDVLIPIVAGLLLVAGIGFVVLRRTRGA